MNVIDDHGIMLGYVLESDRVLMMLVGELPIHVEVLFQSEYEPDHSYSGIQTRYFDGLSMSGIMFAH